MDGERKERLYAKARFSLISVLRSRSRDLIVRSDARTKLESGVIAGRLHATYRIYSWPKYRADILPTLQCYWAPSEPALASCYDLRYVLSAPFHHPTGEKNFERSPRGNCALDVTSDKCYTQRGNTDTHKKASPFCHYFLEMPWTIFRGEICVHRASLFAHVKIISGKPCRNLGSVLRSIRRCMYLLTP